MFVFPLWACVLSCFRPCATLWTVARQAPLSVELSRKECWSGLPCPPPGDLPDPGLEPESPVSPALQAGSLPLSHRGSRSIPRKLRLKAAPCWLSLRHQSLRAAVDPSCLGGEGQRGVHPEGYGEQEGPPAASSSKSPLGGPGRWRQVFAPTLLAISGLFQARRGAHRCSARVGAAGGQLWSPAEQQALPRPPAPRPGRHQAAEVAVPAGR